MGIKRPHRGGNSVCPALPCLPQFVIPSQEQSVRRVNLQALLKRVTVQKPSLPGWLILDAHIAFFLARIFILGLPLAASPAHAQAPAGVPAETGAHQRTADAAGNAVVPAMSQRARADAALVIPDATFLITQRARVVGFQTPRVDVGDAAGVVLRAAVETGHAAEGFGVAEVFSGSGVVAVTLACESGCSDALAAVDAVALG